MRLSTSFRGLLCKPAPTGSLVTEFPLSVLEAQSPNSRCRRGRGRAGSAGEEASLCSPGPRPPAAPGAPRLTPLRPPRLLRLCLLPPLHRVVGTHGSLMYGSDREGDEHLLREGACPKTHTAGWAASGWPGGGRQEPEGQRRRGSFRGGGKQGRQSTQPRVGSAGVNNLWTLSNSGVSACLVPGPGVT